MQYFRSALLDERDGSRNKTISGVAGEKINKMLYNVGNSFES